MHSEDQCDAMRAQWSVSSSRELTFFSSFVVLNVHRNRMVDMVLNVHRNRMVDMVLNVHRNRMVDMVLNVHRNHRSKIEVTAY